MAIDVDTYNALDRAMESVLLLYFHIVKEGGITNDQTVYLNQDSFDGFSFLGIEIDSKYDQKEYESIIRDGAIIYLVCELNDYLGEYEDDYLLLDQVKKIIFNLERHSQVNYLEVAELLKIITVNGCKYDYVLYKSVLDKIYEKYVLEKIYVNK